MSDTEREFAYRFDLSRYEILEKIGGGAYGTVYKAREAGTGRICACKILNKEIDDRTGRDDLRNLVREVVNMSRALHPAIVKFVGFSAKDAEGRLRPVIVSEFLPRSLQRLVDDESNGLSELDGTDKLMILYGVASAMAFLHEHGIVHRDLKLDNILLDSDKRAKVVDFGFSKCIESAGVDISDSVGGYKGTPLYSSPEILLEHAYTKAGDVYAFGMVAYIVVTNEIPFRGCTLEMLQAKIASGARPNLELIIGSAYRSLIGRCLDHDHTNRPTFADIVKELETNADFITSDIDEGEFFNYVDEIKDSPISFDESPPIISIDQYNELIAEQKREKGREHFILSKNFFFGHDTAVDKRKSADNCKSAAELGDIEGIFNYGLMLFKGDGVAKNDDESERYINLAYQKDENLSFQNFYADDDETREWLNKFKIKKYIELKKELYEHILGFVEDNIVYNTLTDFLDKLNLRANKEEFILFFKLIIDIANNHQRHPNFIDNIKQIIIYYQDDISTTFTNYEIFDLFKSNKLIVLFLFESNIIKMEHRIYLDLIDIEESNGTKYCYFFFPEINKFVQETNIKYKEIETLTNENKRIIDFDVKRHIGENDSYLCWLIRQDQVDEFKIYTYQENISLTSKIKPSIFETNSFLNMNRPTIIEYAAFFGSIKIIKYILNNNSEPSPSLWLYSIHSKNLNLINFLVDNKIQPNESKYDEIQYECIKCHHNCISDYIRSNFMTTSTKRSKHEINNILRYHNYSYFTYSITEKSNFYELCHYCYYELVNFYIKIKENEIKNLINNHISAQII